MSSYQARIRAMFTPKPDGVYTKLVGQPELTARLCQQAWHRAEFYRVKFWTAAGEHGQTVVQSNLLNGLPPEAYAPEPGDEEWGGALQMEQAA